MEIRPFLEADEGAVIRLWTRCRLVRPHNNPQQDIARKLLVQRDLFVVAIDHNHIIGSVLAGYDGHRGWLNYLAVDPEYQGQGIARKLLDFAETGMRRLGCPKINIQVRTSNLHAKDFYLRLGFQQDEVISMGKRLEEDRAQQ